MALLFGILFGLGRLSADREFVALQACGVSVFRICRPIALLAVLGLRRHRLRDDRRAAGRQPDVPRDHLQHHRVRRRERHQAARLLHQLPQPRALRARHPAGRPAGATCSSPTRPSRSTPRCSSPRPDGWCSTAPSAHVELVLENGTQHTTSRDQPGRVRRQRLRVDGDQGRSGVDLSADPDRQGRQREDDRGARGRPSAENPAKHQPANSQLFTIQQKFSLPVACLVLALIGVALGASNRKDGKLASFALGIGVVFVYYILLYSPRAGGARRAAAAASSRRGCRTSCSARPASRW